MEKRKIRPVMYSLVLAGFLLLPLVGKAQAASPPLPPNTPRANEAPDVTRRVDCNSGQTIQEAVDNSNAGDGILVSGTCFENVNVGTGRVNVTINGQGTTTVIAADPTLGTIRISGRGITITGLNIPGGRDGVRVFRGGTATITGNVIGTATSGPSRDGIVVNRGAEATIDGNMIQKAARFGINLNQGGIARIVNNTVQNNTNNGILVDENSSARIGFLTFSDTAAAPNTIQGNGVDGIRVTRSAAAVILGNTISSNSGWGVRLERASHADIGANTINANGVGGILFRENSVVNLGQTGIVFDAANSTTVLNTGPGLRCREGGVARGSLGTLNGTAGPKDFGVTATSTENAAIKINSEGCLDRTTP